MTESNTPGDLARQICQIGRHMWDKSFVAANDGNISARLPDGTFLCTPTGVSKGAMTPEDLIVVDADGAQVAGTRKSTSEVRMHLAIYRARPDVQAVAHAHPPTATAFAIAERPLPAHLLPEFETLLGVVPIAAYATPGTQAVADHVVAELRDGVNTMLLSHHGAVAFDATLERAWFHLETLENYARVVLALQQLGDPSSFQLSDAQMAAILESKRRMGLLDPRLS